MTNTIKESNKSNEWVSRRSEAFHHLPPPARQAWMDGDSDSNAAENNAATPWQIETSSSSDQVQIEHLTGVELAAAFNQLPQPDGEAAPFAWANRALCKEALKITVRADTPATTTTPVRLHIHHQAGRAVDAPLLIINVEQGAQCLLLHTHSRAKGLEKITQNFHMHIHVAEDASLQHLRIADVQKEDHLAHVQNVDIQASAQYHQALCTSGCAYQLQRSDVDLHGAGANLRHAGLLLTGGLGVDQQVYTRHNAPDTESHVQTLTLASGKSRSVANAFTYIAPGARRADVHQRLWGIALDGQPRLILRPHLEILHDQVSAEHGATWGRLPEDALFYAQQRGLDPATARRLIIEGKARALLERALPDLAQDEEAENSGAANPMLVQWLEGDWLVNAISKVSAVSEVEVSS